MSKRAHKSRAASTVQSPPAPWSQRLRPWLLALVAALWVARPLAPSESAGDTGDGLAIVMLWLLVATGAVALAATDRRATFRFAWADVLFLALIGWTVISSLLATRHGAPRPSVNMLWEWVGMAVAYFAVRQLVVGHRQVRALAAVMIALAAAEAGYGMYQYVVTMPETRAFYNRDPEGALRAAGVNAPEGSRQRVLFQQRLQSTEPMGTFALTNSLAGFLAPWLTVALAVGVTFWSASWRGRSRASLGITIAALMMVACLVLTKSRAAFLALMFGAVLIALLVRPAGRNVSWRVPVAGALAVLATTIVAALSGVLDREVVTEAGKSLGYRVQYWQATWRMIADRPWFGCGAGNFQGYYTRCKLPEASEVVADPHNFLFEIAATAGVPALIALVGFLACIAYAIVRREGRPAEHPQDAMFDAATSPVFVLGGGAAGFALAWIIGPLTTVPLSFGAAVGGLFLYGAIVWLLHSWVEQGQLSVRATAIASVVLLTNLLAAGGIGMTGVAGTLWLLAALSLALVNAGRTYRLPPMMAGATAIVLAAIALSFYWSAYRPVLASHNAEQLALANPRTAEVLLQEAAVADPLSAEPWQKLAALAWARWQADPKDAHLDRFKQASSQAIALAPQSSAMWLQRADALSSAYDQTKRSQEASDAVDAYRRAIELYPNSALAYARLAEVLAKSGDAPAAEFVAGEALHFDELSPHADMKLDEELRNRLLRILKRAN